MRRLLLAIVCVPVCFAADLTVGSASAHSGQRATGVLAVPAGVDAAAEIPVIVVNGAKPGPTLALLAGAHGTEYASIVALEKLRQSLHPAEMSGAVVIVPLLNVASFAQKVPHLNPVDGKNMNRFYPGKADGTQTERASWAISQNVAAKADYILDFHGGDLDENMRQYAYWAATGNAKLDAVSRGMVLAFGLDHIIVQDFRQPSASVTLTRYGASIGKPSVAVEAGHAGTVNAEDVDALVEGVRSVMRHLHMLAGDARPVERPLWITRYVSMTSERDGIFYPLAAPEAYVEKGMRIGYVTDYVGNRIWDAVAPISGVILYIGAVPSMKKGVTITNIGETGPAPPIQ
jgi:predicted deacylase